MYRVQGDSGPKLTVVCSTVNDETTLWNRIFVDPSEAWKYHQECERNGGKMTMFTAEIEDVTNLKNWMAG